MAGRILRAARAKTFTTNPVEKRYRANGEPRNTKDYKCGSVGEGGGGDARPGLYPNGPCRRDGAGRLDDSKGFILLSAQYNIGLFYISLDHSYFIWLFSNLIHHPGDRVDDDLGLV